MFTVIVNRILLVYESIRTSLLAGKQIIIWLFEKTFFRLALAVALISLIIWLAFFFYFVKSIDKNWEDISNKYDLTARTDAIVALTGGSERVRYSLHLLDQNYAKTLFISGVNKDVKLRELLKLYKITDKGYLKLKDKIILGYEAIDTVQNAEEIAEWLRYKNIRTVRLVTSNYHIDRALKELRSKVSDKIDILPHPVIPINVRMDNWWEFSGSRNLLFREYNKLILASIRIQLEKLGISFN